MKSHFVCQECGATALKWLGRCPSCGEYDTMVEEPVVQKASRSPVPRVTPKPLADVPYSRHDRCSIGISELDRVLGGGFVPGSLTLLGGDPGIGKSTLMLQISGAIARTNRSVLYVNGEESAYQVRMRAERLKIDGKGIEVLSTTDLENIIACAQENKPDFMVIDSIQTVYKPQLTSAPGSVAQVRECGGDLMRFAKEHDVMIVIIGHVTKFGAIAGPKTLEHMVDTVLYFEGDKSEQYRVIRAIKNRFGSTNEIGVFEMTETGLQEVANPSSLFMSDSVNSGSAIISVIEGSRPLLVEVQALTSPTFFNYPQRVATGIDYKRLSMLLAVLERRVGVSVYGVDCFVNVVGGIKVYEPTSDLGILLAIASSIHNVPIDRHTVVIGEVGLGGEVRPVYGIQTRLKEAEKLGFTHALVPRKNTPVNGTTITIHAIGDAKEAVHMAVKE
ncbi:DNA repair protein RadA [candidate division WOR-3 bacterium]|nr:DNA repair protein RadA [candidate division WOR-3 bacterium]